MNLQGALPESLVTALGGLGLYHRNTREDQAEQKK